ncbi:S-adenosyl-L-methionine-dependent methyltransferase [Limtongia smithiae]|uniref:S-adenosyl-L-methionine-dependent methyltransferase n=1 Tax=Limtongia smithiae TaxID=1125753 RepID=UPI0034CFE1C0
MIRVQLRSLASEGYTTFRRTSSTFSPGELLHFNALASTWWDHDGPSRLLHKMNTLRLSFIFDTLDTYAFRESKIHNMSVLDVGCGGGILAESLARHSRVNSVVGIDMSSQVLAVAEEHKRQDPQLALDGKLNYRLCSIFDLPQLDDQSESGKYDMVTLFEILEHVPEPAAVLAAATKLVRPGGFIFMSTMNRTCASYLTTILVGEKLLGIVPEGTHTWSKYINEAELREWFSAPSTERLREGHWDVVKSEGCVYVPILGWKFGGPRDLGNYFLAARRQM